MIGIGLGIRLRMGGGFSPATLFGGGGLGASFDPGDRSTLFQDVAGTVPVTAPGQTVGRMLDRSGNGCHATQADLAKRPVYAREPKVGTRNLLQFSADILLWARSSGTLAPTADGLLGGQAAFRVADASPSEWNSVQGFVRPTAPGVHTASVRLKKETSVTSAFGLRVQINTGGPSAFAGGIFNALSGADVTFGAWSYGARTTAIVDMGTYWLVSVTFSLDAGHAIAAVQAFPAHYSPNGASDASSNMGAATFAAPQCERGALVTAYQRTDGYFDVTEAGVEPVFYLASDLVDDSLPATVPSLGTAATVWEAQQTSASILTGQTVAAGAFNALRGAKTYAAGAINRALTGPQTIALMSYLAAQRTTP